MSETTPTTLRREQLTKRSEYLKLFLTEESANEIWIAMRLADKPEPEKRKIIELVENRAAEIFTFAAESIVGSEQEYRKFLLEQGVNGQPKAIVEALGGIDDEFKKELNETLINTLIGSPLDEAA